MIRVADPRTAEYSHAWFEAESLEVLSGQLIITGYWTGIRGIRFVRPTLTLAAGEERHRLLAEIDDKPWAAEAGRPWRAKFPWKFEGADVSGVELTVATDIAIPLPAPEGSGRPAESPGSPPGASPEASKLRRDVKDARDRFEREQAENDRLRDQLRAAEKAALDAAAAIARRDFALSKLDEVTAELDRAAASTKAAAAARDHALSERDEAFHVRDEALRERDRASTELATAKRDLRSVLDRAEGVAQEARRLQSERDQALETRVVGPPWREPSLQPTPPAPAAAAPAAPRPTDQARTAAAPVRAPLPPISDGPPAQPARVQIPVLTNPARRRHELSLRNAGWLRRLGAVGLLVACLGVLALILHML